jgi:hypothetical protein
MLSFVSLCTEEDTMLKPAHICALLIFALAPGLHARADETCDGKPVTQQQFQTLPADIVQPRHIELVRPFTGNGKLEFSICNAEVHVRSSPQASELKLVIDMGAQPDGYTAANYIHTFHVAPDQGKIHLKFSKATHASVTLVVPMHDNSNNEFDFGKGDVSFNAIGSAGRREINVGMGHMKLLVDGDKDYSGMEVNIGMGSLRDHRPGGHNGHIVVSRNYSGSGNGPLEINVGMGSLDITQE